MTARKLSAALLVLAVTCVTGQHRSKFQHASASSEHSVGTFSAGEAVSEGTGYWCSSGSHGPGQVVTWTGRLGASQSVSGLKLDWAYAPGEFKVLTSSDGGNFEEVACWRPAGQPEASFQEVVMFDDPRAVRVMAVVMRSPGPWGYFGLNHATLIGEPGPAMLVSGSEAGTGEVCVVSTGKSVQLEGCLQSIASGTSGNAFKFNERSQLVSLLNNQCAAVANGDVSGGGSLVMQDCSDALEANDGRSVIELTAAG